MNARPQRHADFIMGIIRGWDRLRCRGTLKLLAHAAGMNRFQQRSHRLIKDFGDFASQASRQVRKGSLDAAQAAGRPVVHLDGPMIGQGADRAGDCPFRWH